MLQVNWPVVDTTIHPSNTCNKFATGVKIKATGELELNDSPGYMHVHVECCVLYLHNE